MPDRDHLPESEERGNPPHEKNQKPIELTDSSSDQQRLKQDVGFTHLPEIEDIPEQDRIKTREYLGDQNDLTIASDDEEGIRNGKDILDDDTEIVMGTTADVTEEDLQVLGDKDRDMDMGDDELVSSEGLDDEDAEGAPLNEAASDEFTTGDDLDVPHQGSNPTADAMGQGDEENDYYSLDDQDNEGTEGIP